ncbi:Cytosolic carboxypeptidase NnaD [Melipona quadrifasciata]|uniref:Cytosolic carboxypeptidase NnaD n=1 Tax=Melipona quadrifasciata TaxID=166423 RepID=A0A0N0BJ48_9HYME|nr:Cytosolic carboxypeptidase NnaD [Melipona quadrifasciata]
MKDLLTDSKVKELQAMLFPVQPIPGGALANLNKLQELQLLQLGRCDLSRRETELSLLSMPFGTRDDQSQETLRSILDTHCTIDGIIQETARWPTECQVLPERVRHIEYAPSVPEPFYVPTGKEPRPKPIGDEFGTVIFRYHPTSVTSYFSRSCVGGSTVAPFPAQFPADSNGNESKNVEASSNVFLVTKVSDLMDTNSDLHFESRFESGNLCKVVKITDTYYQLYLRKDLYTQRHTQWYYFRISNTRSRTNYRLSIVNLCKEESLYNEGLRPLLYSIEDAKTRAVGWRRCGENIAYYRNDSSHIMKNIDNDNLAIPFVLRERFVFKLVPMLNPDGVIVGNNRCSLSGKDLNRQYRTVMRESYPSVWHTKLMIRRLLEECGVAIYCDLHAHSRKHNIFVYGCESKRTASQTKLSEQVFPLMLHKNAADKFSFENCKFHVEKGKEGTGRVVVWSMGVQNSYTMEASMGGTKIGSRSGTHFSTQDYEQIGKVFCETLLDFFDPDPMKEKLRSKIITRLMKGGSNAEEPTNIDLTDYSSDEGDTSDSSISEKEEIEFLEGTWNYTLKEPPVSPQYLCAPPPTPTFIPPRSLELARRRSKKGTAANRGYLRRKRMLTRRAVMDLPTLDPGSDLCDYIDSADEGLPGPERFSERIQKNCKEEVIRFMNKETEEITSDGLILPEIVRSHSMSLNVNENFSVDKEESKANRRSHCLRLVRSLRHRSPVPLKSQDIQIKLSSLRQQIWMGVPLDATENIDKSIEHPIVKGPLSWGISNMALTRDKINNKILLKSTKKLQFLKYIDKENNTKEAQNKYKRKDTIRSKENNLGAEPQDTERKPKKKKSPSKWQKIINLNSKVEELRHRKTSFLTIKADTLKLVTLEVPSKVQTQQHKIESRKHQKDCATRTISNGGKTLSIAKSQMRLQPHSRSHVHLQPLIVPLCDSFSSDNESTDSHKQRISKKKYKKKQLKKTKPAVATGKKKRATSASALRNP